jgi:hypothetical protein
MGRPATVESTQADDALSARSSPAPVIPLTGARRRRAFIERLAHMTPEQRLDAVRSGRFTRSERTAWAARYPDEVPLINGELPWIARHLADLD